MDKLKTILIVTPLWPTRSNSISGIFVAQQARALGELGVGLTVIAGRPFGKRGRHLTPSELGLPDNVRFYSVLLFRVPDRQLPNCLALTINNWLAGLITRIALARLRRCGSQPEGVIIHGLRYFGTSVRNWIPGLGARRMLVIHGIDPFLDRPVPFKWIRRVTYSLNALFDNFILVGSPLLPYASALGLDPDKVLVLPNGTDLPAICDSATPKDDHDPVVIVSVCNLIRLKGIDHNLEALHHIAASGCCSSWIYRIVGDGPERGRLEALAISLGIANHVQFLGRLAYQDTMRVISDGDIFSLPSWGEAFGIVYLEAMARGKPVIGCLGMGAADIVTHGHDGLLVPPKEPEILADVLRRLIEDPLLRGAIGEKARKTVKRFTWDANARRMLGLLGSPTEPGARSGSVRVCS